MAKQVKVEIVPTGLDAAVRKLNGAFGGMSAGSGGGGKGGASSAIAGGMGKLGDILLKVVGGISILALVSKGIMGAIQPILDMITVFITVLVLPLAIFLNAVIKPVFLMLMKYLLPIIKGIPAANKKLEAILGESNVGVAMNRGGEGGAAGAAADVSGIEGVLKDIVAKFLELENIIAEFSGLGTQFRAGVKNLKDFWDITTTSIQALRTRFDIGIGIIKEWIEAFATAFRAMKVRFDIGVDIVKSWIEVLGTAFAAIKTRFDIGVGIIRAWVDTFDTILTAAWTTGISAVRGLAKWIWDTATGVLKPVFDFLKPLSTWLSSLFKSVFNFVSDQLKGPLNLGKAMFNAIMDAVNAAVDAAKKLMSSVQNAASGLTGGVIPKAARDLIISPSGAFSTHPDDFLIATKNPHSLGGGGNYNITINVSVAKMDSSSDIEALAERLSQAMERNLKRAGNYAGSR